MGSLKRKLSKRVNSNIQSLMNTNWDYIALSSQTDFNSGFSPDELTAVYDYALALLKTEKKELAFSLLKRICAYPYPLAFRADGLAHMALLQLSKALAIKSASRDNLLDEAQHHLRQSIALDPQNTYNSGAWVLYHYLKGDYPQAAQFFLTMADSELKNYVLLHSFCHTDGLHEVYSHENPASPITAYELIYDWAKTVQSVYRLRIGLVLGQLYNLSGAFLKAYQLYDSLLGFATQEPLIYSRLGETCWHLDRIADAEQYYRQALTACEALLSTNSDLLCRDAIQEIMLSSRTNLAAIACEQGKDIDDSIAALEQELSNGSTSNPIYHNLAMFYFWKRDYQRSLDYCYKALALAQDETTMHLIAKNLHAEQQFRRAAEWYEKALEFIHSHAAAFHISSPTAPDSFSFARPEWLDSKKKDILINLVHCYLDMGEIDAAQGWHSKASAQWPRDDSLAHLKKLIHSFAQAKQNTAVLEKKSRLLSQQKSDSHRIQQIAKRLVSKFPGSSLAETTDGAIDWVQLEAALHNWAVERKEKATPQEAKLYPVIKQEIETLFLETHQLTKDFLTTAEFLYRIHSQNADMDYSPVLIEYCKALENELTVYLNSRNSLRGLTKNTLGSLGRILKQQQPDHALSAALDLVLAYRNMAAHSEAITKEMAETVRDGIFQQGWLKFSEG